MGVDRGAPALRQTGGPPAAGCGRTPRPAGGSQRIPGRSDDADDRGGTCLDVQPQAEARGRDRRAFGLPGVSCRA